MQGEITLTQLLQDWLLALKDTLRPTSFIIYQGEVQNHLVPLLGHRLIGDLTVSAGEELQENLLNKGLSERMVNDVVSKLGQALRWGLDHGYEVSMVRQASLKQESQETRFLTSKELLILENSLNQAPNSLCNMIVLVLHAGLTIGELCALSWQDIDLNKQEMNVHRICQRASSGLVYSEIEPRILPLPKNFRIDNSIFHNGYFLRHKRGDCCEPRLCQFWLKKHLKENQMSESITFITLRNTYIKNLMKSGTDFIQVSYLSGCKDLNALWKKFGEFYQVKEAS